jgi:hypothetical protein
VRYKAASALGSAAAVQNLAEHLTPCNARKRLGVRPALRFFRRKKSNSFSNSCLRPCMRAENARSSSRRKNRHPRRHRLAEFDGHDKARETERTQWDKQAWTKIVSEFTEIKVHGVLEANWLRGDAWSDWTSQPPPRALMSWTEAMRRWPESWSLSRSACKASRLASTTSR